MLRRYQIAVASLILCLAVTLPAQTTSASSAGPTAAHPTVSFTLDFPESVPSHYSISVAKDGSASYDSMGKLTPEAEGDPFSYTFTMSPANVARLFELSAKAKYFSEDVEYRKGRQANTGKKTLGFQEASEHHEVTYNYSNHPPIQQLTRLFQSIASTMEFARRLREFHRYQRLALEEELKRMEEMSKDKDPRSRDLEEMQAIAPILHEIFDDKTVLNISRARAQRLLAVAQASVDQL